MILSRGYRHQHSDSEPDSPALPELHQIVGGLGCWPGHISHLMYSASKTPQTAISPRQSGTNRTFLVDSLRWPTSFLKPPLIACTSKREQRRKISTTTVYTYPIPMLNIVD
jgi:hypothetical protein